MNYKIALKMFCILNLIIITQEFLFAQKNKKENSIIQVMSFNIRYKNSIDGINIWENRRDFVCDIIHSNNPGIIGLQEVKHEQFKDLLERLPDYEYLDPTKKQIKEEGERNSIFYKPKVFELLESNTFNLSENPEINNSIGWDAAQFRIVNWCKFRIIQTEKILFFFNTHFDHKGVIAREESAKLLLKKIAEIAGNYDAIICGDFNTSPSTKPYKYLIHSLNEIRPLFDTYEIAGHIDGPSWTFHGFGKKPIEKRDRIDYIFINKKVKVNKLALITKNRDPLYPSDHLPIMARIKLK